MPMSNPWHLPPVLNFARAVNPRRILDVGIGMGTYGFMLRQHMDIGHERLERKDWQLTIHGVELFEPYRNPVWDYAYDKVFIGDITKLLPSLESYDLIVCNDVLEHFELNDAQRLMDGLLDKAPVVISTTPNIEWPQGAWGGNEAETHRCLLSARDIPHLVVEHRTLSTTCFISTKDPGMARQMRSADDHCARLIGGRSGTLPYRIKSKVKRVLGLQ